MFKIKLVILVIILNNLDNILSDELISSFERNSVLYGISVQANYQIKNNASNNGCYRDLNEFYNAANKKFVWAFKMMDVSGRPGQGFLAGNNGWTGQSTVCADLTNREPLEVYREKIVQLVTDHDFPPFEMGFVTAFLRHDNQLQLKTNTPLQNLIQLGLCIPESCNAPNIKPLLEIYFEKRVLTFQKLYETNFTIENMKTISPNSDWLMKSTGNIIILTIIIGIMILIAAITYYDLNIYQVNQRKTFKNKTLNEDIPSKQTLETIEEEIEEDPIEEIKKIENIYEKILLCFSWSKTHRLLLHSEVPDSVGAINGMMFFGMVFMAIYNYLLYSAQYLKHLPMEFRKYETFLGQIVANSSFSIDTYLFLSGCLVSYKFYEFKHNDLSKMGLLSKISEFVLMIFERIFKTFPVYIMWILWTVYIFSYLDARWPIPVPEMAHENCAKTWWRNILHINNFYPNENACMSWTWLIAADIQYFVVNTFLLILSTMYLKLSIAIIGTIILFSIYSTGIAAYNIGYIHTLDQQLLQNDAIYHLPWQRIGPYGVGMLTGLLLYKLNGKLPLQKKLIWICWAIAPMINCYLIFGLTGIKPTVEHSTVFIAVGRTAWAVGLAWVLVACSTGNAGYLNTILSYGGFQMFHRLAYSSYILMVLNIIFLCVTFENTIFFSTISYISQVFSVALFPYLLNCIFTLHYEIPFELLWKTFIRQ